AVQPAPRLVTAVKSQGDGAEQPGQPFRPRPYPRHGNSPPARENIVNPDASAPRRGPRVPHVAGDPTRAKPEGTAARCPNSVSWRPRAAARRTAAAGSQ